MFKAVVRTGPIPRGGTDGSLLRALPDGSVDFTGTNPDDPTTGTQVSYGNKYTRIESESTCCKHFIVNLAFFPSFLSFFFFRGWGGGGG